VGGQVAAYARAASWHGGRPARPLMAVAS